MALPLIFFFLLILTPTLSLPINVWPKPQRLSWPTPTSTTLSPHFKILSPLPLHPILHPAITRLLSSLSPNPPPLTSLPLSPTLLLSLSLSISSPSTPLRHAVDESYTLSISPRSANLTAPTLWGALHGLQTFSQLTWNTNPTYIAANIVVSDWPDFAYRGVVLDTSRNFYPKKDVLRTIDALAMNKLNVFHWHVTDSHSFPIVLPSEKGLAEKGAYGEGMRYGVEDVREIVEYGVSRGVRVVPEIDMPGEFWFESMLDRCLLKC